MADCSTRCVDGGGRAGVGCSAQRTIDASRAIPLAAEARTAAAGAGLVGGLGSMATEVEGLEGHDRSPGRRQNLNCRCPGLAMTEQQFVVVTKKKLSLSS